MKWICPTVTATDPHAYREQIERIAPFAERIHIDLADGKFTDNRLIDLAQVWWPSGKRIDIHLMYQQVEPYIDGLIALEPDLVVVQAEAHGSFYEIAKPFKRAKIKVGVALLADTPVSQIEKALDNIDHVLIFSGHLGYFGGKADLTLLDKIIEIKKRASHVEIGWDGGINENNITALAQGGVDVFNVGGGIQRADDPRTAYAKLKKLVKGQK